MEMPVTEIKVSEQYSDEKLKKYLFKYFKKAPQSFIYKMLRKKNIVLNGKKDTGKTILLEGDSIKVFFSDETFDKMRGLETSKSEYEHLKGINYSLDVIYNTKND
jgi:23S rRNA pseudouridine955/2504/2580 synthase